MIPHQKNKFINAWFADLSRRKFKKTFHRMSLTTRSEIPRFESKVPTIVVANHPSWWDALLVCDLSGSLLKREFLGVFDAEQLRRYGIFRFLGGFAVEKKNDASEMRQFLRYTRQELEGRDRLLWVFAQGDIVSAEEPIRLKRGFAAVAGQLERAQLLKINISYDFWLESKPEVVVDILPLETLTGSTGSQAVDDLTARIEQEMEEARLYVRDLVRRHDRSRLKSLWENPAGANPIYDVYRRMKALFTGKEFHKSHAD